MKKCIYDSNIDDLKLMLFIVAPFTKTLYMTQKAFHLPISCLYPNLSRYLCPSVTKNSILKNAFCKFDQEIIQKKLASGSQMLPFVIFDKKCPFYQKICYFKLFLSKTMPKVTFLKDFGCCPKFLDYTLLM